MKQLLAGIALGGVIAVAGSAVGQVAYNWSFIPKVGLITTTPVQSRVSIGTAAPATTRAMYGGITLVSGINMTSGNIAGSRGSATIPSGTTVSNSAAYVYGGQGKLIGGGTISNMNGCGLCAQWDFSSGTYSGGTISGLWIDAGTSASASAQSTSFGGDSHLLRITNTTNSGAALTSDIMEIDANSNLFMTLLAPQGVVNYSAVGGAGANSCAKTGGAVCAKALHIQLNGVDYWLPLYSSNS